MAVICGNITFDIGYSFIYAEYNVRHSRSGIYIGVWCVRTYFSSEKTAASDKGDGSLYVKFDGTWGCKVEVWFWGEVEDDISSRDPDECDPYWYGSTVIIWDDFVYFVDEEDMTVDQISDGYCWFKARHMKYRIIPD